MPLKEVTKDRLRDAFTDGYIVGYEAGLKASHLQHQARVQAISDFVARLGDDPDEPVE